MYNQQNTATMTKKKQIERVNFHKQFQLHKVCANDGLRPVMNYVFFHNGYAYATDAHVAVKAKLEDICNFPPEQIEMLEGYLLHRKHFELILKANFVQVEKVIDKETGSETVQFRVFGDNNTSCFIPLIKEGEGFRYPNCDKAVFDKPVGNEPMAAVGLNYGLLGALKAAMGIQAILEMRFSGNGKQIDVTSSDVLGLDIRGIIMSILVE